MPGKDKALAAVAGGTGVALAAWRLMFPWVGDDIKTIQAAKRLAKSAEELFATGRFLIDTFEMQVKRFPKKAFLLFEDKVYTYEFIDEMANRIANVAAKWNLPVGDTVAMMVENEPAFVWTFLGLQKIGIASAFINFHLTAKPLLHSIKASDAKVLIVGSGDDLLSSIEEIRDQIPGGMPIYVQGKTQEELPAGYISMDDELTRVLPVPVCKAVRASLGVTSPLCYIYTSGTTGLPKPAILSQGKGMAVSKIYQIFKYNENDTSYVVTPLYHSAATTLSFFNSIDQGATMAMRRKFSARHFWEDVRKYNVTVIQYIGELCRYLLRVPEHPLDGVHNVRVAYGNGLRKDIWDEFHQRFKVPHIIEFFAATEGTSLLVNVCMKRGAVGRHSPITNMFINGKSGQPSAFIKFDKNKEQPVRGDDGLCIAVKPGDEGLVISGIAEDFFEFYKGPKEMNEKKIIRNVFQKGDRWFNYGDLLYLDKDYFLYFRDRLGDTFRWKSENVSTVEVANVLSVLEFVQDVNVYGVEIPGSDGRAGMAAILLKVNHKVTSDTLKQIYQYCEHNLPSYARPLFLRFMDELHLTQTMKNRKVELVQDGFDPRRVSDPLYYVDIRNKTYVPLDMSTYQSVLTSKL